MANKTWFITGTSRGFGREWTKAALERGDRVAATARDTSTLDDLEAEHGDALPCKASRRSSAADTPMPRTSVHSLAAVTTRACSRASESRACRAEQGRRAMVACPAGRKSRFSPGSGSAGVICTC